MGARHNHAPAHAQAGDRHTPRQMIDTRPLLFVSCVETLYESITFWIQSLELSATTFAAHSAPCIFAASRISERATIPCGSLPGWLSMPEGHSRPFSLAPENKSGRYIGTRQNHAPAHATTTHRHTPTRVIDTRPESGDAKMAQLLSFFSCVEVLYVSITFWNPRFALSATLFVAHAVRRSSATLPTHCIFERVHISSGPLWDDLQCQRP